MSTAGTGRSTPSSASSRSNRTHAQQVPRSLPAPPEAEIGAEGVVGDADPLQAIDDALRIFPADEIVVSTHPEGRSNWLARGLVERARRRFTQPIVHVVVDDARIAA